MEASRKPKSGLDVVHPPNHHHLHYHHHCFQHHRQIVLCANHHHHHHHHHDVISTDVVNVNVDSQIYQDEQVFEEEEDDDEPIFVMTDEWMEFFAKSEARRKLEKKQAKK
ncbi:hypothetical protein ACFE04_003730 [Oxalis oulophora]